MKKLSFLLIILILIVFVWWQRKLSPEAVATKNMQTTKEKVSEATKLPHVDKPSHVQAEHKSEGFKKPVIDRERKVGKTAARSLEQKNREPSSLESYFQSDSITIDQRDYLVSQTLRTVAIDNFESSDGNELMRFSGYVFFESNNSSKGQPALYHSRNKSAAILTGRILLKNISSHEARRIAEQMQVELDTSMAHLGVYAFVAPSDVLSIVAEVGEISEPEIIEGRIREK